MSTAIPEVDWGIVGGSATLGCRLPEDTDVPGVAVVEKGLRFKTPFGETQPFKLLRFDAAHTRDGVERTALAVRIHGWRTGENWSASKGQAQAFWTLEQAGVSRIVGNAGVGAVNHLLDPGDLVLADDFLDETHHRPSALHDTWPNSVNMSEPFCPALRASMRAAGDAHFRRIFVRGVMGVVEGPWLESPAQIRRLQTLGADLVCHSTVPEVHYAREIGACYGAAFLVVDHANGVAEGFNRDVMIRTYREGAVPMATLMLRALQGASGQPCSCPSLRRPLPINWDEPAAPSPAAPVSP